jgi:CDP-paratose 2-epimerase
MQLFITGICGFVGSRVALHLLEQTPGLTIVGIDNLARAGAYTNFHVLRAAGVRVIHGDVRAASDLETIDRMDWIIDAAALPSVLAGVDGKSSSRQLVEHNLLGTINILELARRHHAGMVLLSTSRVYSVEAFSKIPVVARDRRFAFDESAIAPHGCSAAGISERFSTAAPLSLYGATKLASEVMALEYGHAFELPVIINRCGVMAGAGQFGTAEQGIFSYWIGAYAARRVLRYIGFDGAGRQVRDALHPDDLAELVMKQMKSGAAAGMWNVGGGAPASMSLAELSQWCEARFGAHEVQADMRPRRYDAPWIVLDSAAVRGKFNWQPRISLEQILSQIVDHHRAHLDWLDLANS